ncbi:DUF3060 domain-containing protein [Candidatus Poribacteria bacterium]|nr:DUF3060 domain-containing protein [Candidatus Poribacteria bacterium]
MSLTSSCLSITISGSSTSIRRVSIPMVWIIGWNVSISGGAASKSDRVT